MNLRVSNQNICALTRTEILVVISMVAVLILIFFEKNKSDIHSARLYSANIECINNQKEIGQSFRVWANDHNDKYPMQTSLTNGGTMELANGENAWINFRAISIKLTTPKILICPADWDKIATTNFATDFNNSRLSYFISLNPTNEYDPENFARMFLFGDENFAVGGISVKSGLLEVSTNTPISWTAARHRFHGNIGLIDGAVEQVTTNRLQTVFHQSNLGTNCFAIP